MSWWYSAALLAANLALLLPPTSPLRVIGALLLITLLPGLAWARLLLPGSAPFLRWLAGAALSYILTSLVTLGLHFLPGPIAAWQLIAALDTIALGPLILFIMTKSLNGPFAFFSPTPNPQPPAPNPRPLAPSPQPLIPLLIIAVSILLRVLNLGYSEFQGDEALVMISAAEALSGHEDALFLRSKGPGEVLLPMALWRLTGTINETIARLPFTLAALLSIGTVYWLGRRLGGPRLGWLAAGFFAFNGFTVAFGRIVQYQALVIWFSALAVLLCLEWRENRQPRLVFLAGLALGAGLLAHYDAVLALPAAGWLLLIGGLQHSRERTGSPLRRAGAILGPGLLFLAGLLLVALPFYLPYSLDPQAGRTGDYVGGRIGSELRNNLPDFFHFNTFYSSAYYPLVTGLLVLGVLAWWAWRAGGLYRWLAAAALAGITGVVLAPELLTAGKLNLAGLPFVLLLAGAFLALPPGSPGTLPRQALIAWLAVPFLGYNFVVALGLTHIYTTVPAWALLAGIGAGRISESANQRISELVRTLSDTGQRITGQPPTSNIQPLISNFHALQKGSPASILLLLLSTVFLWNAFVRHDVEYWQDYPAGNLPGYWNPYDEPPRAGFFGFAHRAGWKAIGQQIAGGELRGDYGSNEEPDVTTWYTRGAPRACDPRPEYYYLAPDLIDPVEVPGDLAGYAEIATVTLPNQKQFRVLQQEPVSGRLGELSDATLAREFDQSATPAAFTRAIRGETPAETNFSNLVRLIGYDFKVERAYPGGRVPVTLYWQALAPLPASYQVFAHLESSAGPVAQADGVPVCWSYPTDLWRPGQVIADQHAILIPAETPPGDYPLQVGLYRPDTWQRLDVLDQAGNQAGTSLTLGIITIRKLQEP